MGRKLRRVPLDFDWPIDETWAGYLNPFRECQEKCAACDGSGYSPDAKRFKDQWYGHAAFDPAAYGATPLTIDHPEVRAFAARNVDRSPDYYDVEIIGRELAIEREAYRLFRHWKDQWCHHLIQADVDALVADERLWDFTRTPRTEEQREIVRAKIAAGKNSWLPESNGYTPTADEVNAWSLAGMGHDSINSWVCIKARCEREGVPQHCEACGGSGESWPSNAHRELAERYVEIEPPTGDGYQLWETTSEGSPTSPVFATLDELCEWAAGNATTFGSFTASKEDWMRMLGEDFVVHKEGNCVFI